MLAVKNSRMRVALRGDRKGVDCSAKLASWRGAPVRILGELIGRLLRRTQWKMARDVRPLRPASADDICWRKFDPDHRQDLIVLEAPASSRRSRPEPSQYPRAGKGRSTPSSP